MSLSIRRTLTTAAALLIAFAAFFVQAPEANADPVCAEASYTVLGTLSDNLGGCQSTGYDTFLVIDRKTGDPALVEVSVHLSLVLP